jgi:UDP-N-acetylglucosamine transferase subunit ALG13
LILVAVGTFIHGFDALVEAADRATAALGLPGFAQIGHGGYVPTHLASARLLDAADFRDRLAGARLVVCHGGMGIIGEAMRAGRPILAVPRRGATTRANPANDQHEFVHRMAARHGIQVCDDPGGLALALALALAGRPPPIAYRLGTDIPQRIAAFLAGR